MSPPEEAAAAAAVVVVAVVVAVSPTIPLSSLFQQRQRLMALLPLYRHAHRKPGGPARLLPPAPWPSPHPFLPKALKPQAPCLGQCPLLLKALDPQLQWPNPRALLLKALEPPLKRPNPRPLLPNALEPELHRPNPRPLLPNALEPQLHRPNPRPLLPNALEPQLHRPNPRPLLPNALEPQLHRPNPRPLLPNALEPQLHRLNPRALLPNALEPQLHRPNPRPLLPNALKPQLHRPNPRPLLPNALEPQLHRPNPRPLLPNALEPQLQRPNPRPLPPNALKPQLQCPNPRPLLHKPLEPQLQRPNPRHLLLKALEPQLQWPSLRHLPPRPLFLPVCAAAYAPILNKPLGSVSAGDANLATTTPAPLMCSVSETATLSIQYPDDSLCDILMYTHVHAVDNIVMAVDDLVSFDTFTSVCRSRYSKTTCGLSFDSRFITPAKLSTELWREVVRLRKSNVMHLGILNMYDKPSTVRGYAANADEVLKKLENLTAGTKTRIILGVGFFDYHEDKSWSTIEQVVQAANPRDILVVITCVLTVPSSQDCIAMAPTAMRSTSKYPPTFEKALPLATNKLQVSSEVVVAFSFQMATVIYNMTEKHGKATDALYKNCNSFILGDQSQVSLL
ncbi:uncharacterized protein LOC142588747 [Dermacentor variabilis]|uniref:uncharacterized protein LOC142588747 n=1 Tax=Dermacentor variabilis TaxID=34621 RepID=UPI003F5C37EE